MARLVAATSSANDVRGVPTDVTRYPLASSRGITFDQLDPSANAPCTRTTFRTDMWSSLWRSKGNGAVRDALGDPCCRLSIPAIATPLYAAIRWSCPTSQQVRTTRWQCACSASPELFDLTISKAADDVIVHHSDGLHVRVDDRRTDEGETTALQILAHGVG